jgi:hypothetical protein
MKRTLTIANGNHTPRKLCIEPEGSELWIPPGKKFELRATVTNKAAHFSVWDLGDSLQVFRSPGMGMIAVFCDARKLEAAAKTHPPHWRERVPDAELKV